MTPQTGDVLVSTPTATAEHHISIVGEPGAEMCPLYDQALARAKVIAKTRDVDAWLTEDHTHFLRLTACRRRDTAHAP